MKIEKKQNGFYKEVKSSFGWWLFLGIVIFILDVAFLIFIVQGGTK